MMVTKTLYNKVRAYIVIEKVDAKTCKMEVKKLILISDYDSSNIPVMVEVVLQ